jgi:dTDP-4-dehydrorhamnose 3,5-epimerase
MGARFQIHPTPIASLLVVERLPRGDERGFFSRFFCAEELAGAGFRQPVAQINHTLTRRRGSVRGMHFQFPPHAEDKFVSCLKGEIFDVAVDLRVSSNTFLRWHGEKLSADNARSLMIPKGFAHGFQTLTDDCELIYLHSHPYAPDAESGFNVRDPALGIEWPLPITDMSARDARHPILTPAFKGIPV